MYDKAHSMSDLRKDSANRVSTVGGDNSNNNSKLNRETSG